MRKRQIIELLIIIVLGLTPLLWFRDNQVILGHDAGLTLSPISHFVDRLYAWTERFGFGNDQTYAIPGFFIHGLEALIAFLGFNLQEVQKIVFVFWFVLPGLTMYYFASKLSKRFNLKYFTLPVTVFYMFNHFLLQGWFVAERTKFSVYAALPLVMAFLFDWEENKRSAFKTGFFISLTLFILNGEASLPLFGGLILSIVAFIIFYLLKEFSLQRLLKLIKLFAVTITISAFLNAYWLLPYGGYILQSYSSAVSQFGGLSGVLGWLNYVSQDSSFINIFRLQGIPEWYLNPSHPYANVFLGNIFLIAVSFLIPIAAFLPLYLVKSGELRKKVIFFSFLALFSIIFVAGAHPPFGAIYVFLINFVPGFVAFRNPLYKFAPALWFSYAILIGFTINYFLQKFEINKKLLSTGLYFAICIGIILYSFPFLNGFFFDYIKDERSMRVVVPQYIFDFAKWSESKERLNTKMLVLPATNPDNKVDAYTWGYWSLSPLTSLLTNAPIINESNYMSDREKILIEELYRMIKKNDPGWQNLSKLLGIKSFLLRKDFAYNIKGSPTSNPSIYKNTLRSPDIVLVKKFGEWEVYDLKNTNVTNVQLSSKINYLDGEVTDLGKISFLPFFNPQEPIYISAIDSRNPKEILGIRDKTFLVPTCVSCNLQHKFIDIGSFVPLITRDSIFYPLIEFINRLKERKLISIAEKTNYYLYKSLRNILAFDKFVSQKADSGLLIDEIRDYGRSLENLDKPFNDYLLSMEAIDNNFLLEISDVLRIEKTIILRNSNSLSEKEVLNLLNKKYGLLQKITEKLDKNIWRTTDEINKRFLVFSDQDLQFDFLYRPNSSSTVSAMVNFILDDKNYEAQVKPISSGWFSLGKLSLSKGLHKLSIYSSVENLYTGPPSVQLSSSSDFYCFPSNKITGFKNDVFKLSFQHRRLSGSKNFFAKVLPGDTKPNPLDTTGDILRSTSVWDNYSAFWPAQDYSLREDGTFYLTVCNPPSVDKEDFVSTIELKDINIRKITVPDVVLYNVSSAGHKIENKFNKKSQIEYSVSTEPTKTKKVVVLNESYNYINWILEDVKNSTKFTANGYANGWIIEDNKPNIAIKYNLQDFVKLGFVISGISLALGILYMLIIFRKK